MSDSIKNDDEKFSKLLSKQQYSNQPEPDLEKSDDVIENDDENLDRLLMLQEFSQEGEFSKPENKTIEEKYEQEIAIQQFLKKVDEHLQNGEDAFGLFFEEQNNDE